MPKITTHKEFPEHKLEVVIQGPFIKYLFRKENGSYEAVNLMVHNGRTYITGDWGEWIVCRAIDLASMPDRIYLKGKVTAVPHQANKSLQSFWWDTIFDALERMYELHKAGSFEQQNV